MRISVELVLGLLTQGVTPEGILADYPDLEPDDSCRPWPYPARAVAPADGSPDRARCVRAGRCGRPPWTPGGAPPGPASRLRPEDAVGGVAQAALAFDLAAAAHDLGLERGDVALQRVERHRLDLARERAALARRAVCVVVVERGHRPGGYANARRLQCAPARVSSPAMSDLPETMAVVEIASPGGPERLVPARRPVPRPGHGEILIAVAAAGVNRPDVMQRQGRYPPPPGASDLPGLEVAGRVAACGPGAAGFAPGDAVCALTPGGGYAAFCLAPAPQALPIPAGLDATAAAALPEALFTVWPNLFERARLAAGETVLIHGGSSGIGTWAIQLAHAFGARVFATAGSAEKCRACEALGAERAVDYRREDFVAAVKAATGGRGVDVVLDIVAGDYTPRNVDVLAADGRLSVIAVMGGRVGEVDFAQVLGKRLTITGSTLRPRPVETKAAFADALRERVWPLLERGRVKPVIDRTFPLAEAAAAHALMESSAHIGKIVLTT